MFWTQETGQLKSGENPAADVASALRDRFGEDALAVAQNQCDVAEGDQQLFWRDVIEQISR